MRKGTQFPTIVHRVTVEVKGQEKYTPMFLWLQRRSKVIVTRSNQEVSLWLFILPVSLYIHGVKNSKRFEDLGKI